AGLSGAAAEWRAAPVARALRWAGTRRGDDVVVLVPSDWGATRTTRMLAAVRGLGVAPRCLRAALVTPEALPSSSARWAVAVESCRTRAAGRLVARTRRGLTRVRGRLARAGAPRRARGGCRRPPAEHSLSVGTGRAPGAGQHWDGVRPGSPQE